jgi:hypothetical protein
LVTCSADLASLSCTKYLDWGNLVEIVAAAPHLRSATSCVLVTASEEAPSRLILPSTYYFRLQRTHHLNQGGLSYPLQEAPNGYVDGICGQLCNSAWPVRNLTISDGLYNFSELRGADRAARSCSPARAPTSVPPHPASDSDATVYLAGF